MDKQSKRENTNYTRFKAVQTRWTRLGQSPRSSNPVVKIARVSRDGKVRSGLLLAASALTIHQFAMVTNQQIANFYFQPVLDAQEEPIVGFFRCRCSRVRQQAPRTGYSNLVQHVRREHQDFAEVITAVAPVETGTLAPWICPRSLDLFVWLQWTVKRNFPLHFCENPETRRYTNLKLVGQDQLRDALGRLTRRVEASVKAEMPNRYGLVIDGWSFNSEYYHAVFGWYEHGGKPRSPLFAIAPLINQEGDDHSTDSHVAFLREILMRDYGKRLDDCMFIVGDNCSTNRRLATIVGVPLVGCASHRLNLAVQSMLVAFKDDLDQVRELMVKLKSLNQSAKLRFKTSLRPVLRQQTRWSSTFAMVNRYVNLLEFINDDDDLADYLSLPAANRRLRKLLNELKKLESVSKELQSSSASMFEMRLFFDALIAQWPQFVTYLCPRADIMHSPQFEAACAKVQQGNVASLSRAEKTALSRFATREVAEQAATTITTTSFVEQVKKKRKATSAKESYVLVDSIPPTSNIVERLFSIAKATVGTQRHSLQPITLEMVLF